MNLEKVHYLLTAIECGTFSLAAEKLGMTQSGLNRQISSLETELKTTLLLRGRRGVVPAKGAEPIIARLRDLMTAERRVHEEIAAVKGLFQHFDNLAAAAPQTVFRCLSGHHAFNG